MTIASTATRTRVRARHHWLVLGIGVAAQASFAAAFSGIASTGPAMQRAYHYSPAQLGIVFGAVGLGIAVSEVPWGLVTDWLGERKTLLTGLLATGALLTLLAAFGTPSSGGAPDVAVLGLGMLFVGLLGGSVNGSSGRAIMAWFPPRDRGFAMSIRQTAVPAGGALGAAILPVLAADLDFRAVFGTLAAFCFGSALATHRWLHEPPYRTEQHAAAAPTRSPLLRQDVWRLALSSGLLSIPQFGILTFAAVFFVNVRHTGLIVGTLTILVVQLGGAVARVLGGRFTDRRGDRLGYIRGLAALGGLALAAAAVLTEAPVWLTALSLMLGGILTSAWHGAAYTESAAMAGQQRAGTALGLQNTTVFAAMFLAPILLPLLGSSSSWTLAWAVTAGCALLAVPLLPRRAR